MDHLKPEECKDYLFICLDLTAWKEVKALKLDMLPYAELVSNLKERFDVPQRCKSGYPESLVCKRVRERRVDRIGTPLEPKSIWDAAKLCESKNMSNSSYGCSVAQSDNRYEPSKYTDSLLQLLTVWAHRTQLPLENGKQSWGRVKGVDSDFLLDTGIDTANDSLLYVVGAVDGDLNLNGLSCTHKLLVAKNLFCNCVLDGNDQMLTLEDSRNLNSEIATPCIPILIYDDLLKLLPKYKDIFSAHEFDLGICINAKHKISTTEVLPIKQQPRRLPVYQQSIFKNTIDEMLRAGVIRKSSSQWALAFTSLDLATGYFQIEVYENDFHKTAFTTPLGFYEFLVMPFGLKNTPSSFQQTMESLFSELLHKNLLIYLDDIVVFSEDLETHIEEIIHVFSILRSANLKLRQDKCELFKKELKYLG
ncbi:hypothetical protein RF11_03402 [Thelohanellus kitauei]|uniref:Reverse transcriptase domain-containing protein n=1 Tax=Thelohanellus kitauei TaxID=669202 RepID=A0A0C2MSX1_THEKT|nr:hypothetical protein RF11_03402 [Thelohanellus kitauei]